MERERRKNSMKLVLALVMLTVFMVSGCAIGTTQLAIAHYPLDNIENKKQGNILVKQFVDKRKGDNLDLIGNKRNGFGMVLGHVGMQEGVKLDVLMTKSFADALNAAGYNTVVQDASQVTLPPGRFDAIVTGEIIDFWMDCYMAIWHRMDVTTQALHPENQVVVWEKRIEASQANVLWVGATAEFERIINTVLTKGLNDAAQAYASDQFYQAIKKSP